MRVVACVEINAPAELIWREVSDPGRYLHFMSGVTRWEVQGEQRTGRGARYRMLLAVGSAEVGGLIEVVESQAPTDLAWTSITGVDQRGRWRLRQETSLFLSRGETLARTLNLDRLFRLKVLPISISIPWVINVGDFAGHIPLPAKITVEALPPIHLREEFGDEPDPDEVYDHLMRQMQDTLDALAAERRLPVLG